MSRSTRLAKVIPRHGGRENDRDKRQEGKAGSRTYIRSRVEVCEPPETRRKRSFKLDNNKKGKHEKKNVRPQPHKSCTRWHRGSPHFYPHFKLPSDASLCSAVEHNNVFTHMQHNGTPPNKHMVAAAYQTSATFPAVWRQLLISEKTNILLVHDTCERGYSSSPSIA